MCTKRIQFVKTLFSLFIIWTLVLSVAPKAFAAGENGEKNKNELSAQKLEKDEVFLGGFVFGTRIKTDGVLVVDVGEVDGKVSPATDAGILKGDVVLSVNGKKAESIRDVSSAVRESLGSEVLFEIKRGDKVFEAKVKPRLSSDGKTYKSGLYIRDGAAGIGTVTYILPDGTFAGLGHGIADVDTHELIPFKSGSVHSVSLFGIVKGERGKAGELKGRLDEGETGTLYKHSETGVFGKLNTLPEKLEKIKIAPRNKVVEGECKVLSTLDGTIPVSADARIVKILDEKGKTKNFVIEITDKSLLEKTGGIVQGMSGSPIIQNGKLVGAVTHVFINNSTQGYGIFIENMLENAQSVAESNKLKEAS